METFENFSCINKIKSKYIMKQIFSFIKKYRLLKIIEYNKNIQNKLNIEYDDYKKFKDVEIEMILTKYIIYNSDNKYFLFNNSEEKKENYNIYINEKIEYKNYINKENLGKYLDGDNKIKLIFNRNFKSFSRLFKNCACAKKINILKFYRNDIFDISEMFSECLSLEEINFFGFESFNIINMKRLFFRFSALKRINFINLYKKS